MRILLVSEDIPYPSMGGLAKHVLTLAKGLIKLGHEVDLLGGNQNPIEVAGEEGNFGGHFYGELKGHLSGWKESKLGVFLPPKRPWIAQKMAQCILKYAHNYDVIHYHGHFPNIAYYIPKHINFIQTRHDQGSDCLEHTRFRDGEICNQLNPKDCAGCITKMPNLIQKSISSLAVQGYRNQVIESFRRHKTIFVSNKLKENFCRVAGTGEWGSIVHNSVDIEKLKEADSAPFLASDINTKNLTVFIAGKLYAPKGVDVLLEALVPKLPLHMQLIIAGDGPYEAQLRKQFESDRVTFLGWCDYPSVLSYTAASNIVIVPSILEEAFGSTTLEGLLLGKPTFALDRGATPELKKYQRYPDQLHLFNDIDSLVESLVVFEPIMHEKFTWDNSGSVENMIHQLLDIYSMPLGTALG